MGRREEGNGVKKTFLFFMIAPLTIAAMVLQAWRLRDVNPPNYEMWE